MLNKFKSRLSRADDDLPHSSLAADDLVPQLPDRPFMLKLRKGSNLHRFKVKMVSIIHLNESEMRNVTSRMKPNLGTSLTTAQRFSYKNSHFAYINGPVGPLFYHPEKLKFAAKPLIQICIINLSACNVDHVLASLKLCKIFQDTPLKTVLDHLAPEYNVKPELFILQLNDETLDPAKTPSQLGLTVIDIIGTRDSLLVPWCSTSSSTTIGLSF